MKEVTDPKENQSPFSQHNKVPPIIATFTEWTFTDEIKTSFIKAAKNSRNNQIVCVSQMCSLTITNRRNEAMKVRKQLKNEDKQIQAYVKSPAIVIERKSWETIIPFRVLGEISYSLECFQLRFSCPTPLDARHSVTVDRPPQDPNLSV